MCCGRGKRNFSKTLTSFGTVDHFDGKCPFSVEEKVERGKTFRYKTLRKLKMNMIWKHKCGQTTCNAVFYS